jgi:hypothetical protein
MTQQRLAATDKLFGYTTVNDLKFEFDAARSVCDLTLQLENPSSQKAITLVLKEVANLRLNEFGGGLTQLLLLMIEDVRGLQYDRINFKVKEIERGTFECHCRDFEIREAT